MDLLTKSDLAKRWKVSEQTIDEYREKGIIKKVPKISSVRFNPQHIQEIEETKLDRFSPLERKKLEREIEALRQKLSVYEDMKTMIMKISTKMINL